MFGIGMPEMILILIVALIVIGPQRLPDLAKALGRGVAEFRKATREFKESLDIEEVEDAYNVLHEVKEDIDETLKKTETEESPKKEKGLKDNSKNAG